MAITNQLYEYRIANIVRRVLKDESSEGYYPEDGNALEVYLVDNRLELVDALLDDIQAWMGFDDLLRQVKEL